MQKAIIEECKCFHPALFQYQLDDRDGLGSCNDLAETSSKLI